MVQALFTVKVQLIFTKSESALSPNNPDVQTWSELFILNKSYKNFFKSTLLHIQGRKLSSKKTPLMPKFTIKSSEKKKKIIQS